MKTIIFLGTHKAGSSREAIKAAEQLGYFTCLLTNNKKQLIQREEYYDVHLMTYCDLDDLDSIRKKINLINNRSLEVKAIVSFIDPYCAIASQLSADYNLPHFTTSALYTIQNKLKSRAAIEDTSYIPKYQIIDNDLSNLTIALPLVIKYIDSSGSKDVYLCHTEEEFTKYYQTLQEKYPGGVFLIEEYLDGPQYLVEVLVFDNEIHSIAVIAQDIIMTNDHFIVTGYSLLLDEDEQFNQSLELAVTDIINLHGLKFGPCHLEMRLVRGVWKLIEINPRISGAGMNQFIKIGYGINLVRETLKLLLNKPVFITPQFKNYTYAKYIVVEKGGKLFRATGKAAAMQIKGVKYVYLKPRKGNILIPPISMGNRYAFVIATGKTSEEAKRNANEGSNKLKFHYFNSEQVS